MVYRVSYVTQQGHHSGYQDYTADNSYQAYTNFWNWFRTQSLWSTTDLQVSSIIKLPENET